MIEECIGLDIGAKIDLKNVSIIAYCDDILLISPTSFHLNMLIGVCEKFARKWKMEFNPTKSSLVTFGQIFKENNIIMNKEAIPQKDSIIYLGFPIGDKNFVDEFIEKKFSKVEKSFYSLYAMGCKPNGLNPKTIGFIFKQYCQ